MTRVSTPTLKNEMNFSCASISLRAAAVDFGRQVVHITLSQSSVESFAEQAGPRCLGRCLEREHLDVSAPDCEMVAVPFDRTLHNLAVHAVIASQFIRGGPFFEIEEVAEELIDRILLKQLQSERAGEVSFEQGRHLLKIGQHPRGVGSMFLRLTRKGA